MRRRVMASLGKPLPYDADVEYIEVDQTHTNSWIELPYIVNGDTCIDCICMPVRRNGGSTAFALGASNGWMNNGIEILFSANADNHNYFMYGNLVAAWNGSVVIEDFDGIGKICEFHSRGRYATNSFGGQSWTMPLAIITQTHPLRVFLTNRGSVPSAVGNGTASRLYALKVWDSATDGFDLIPVRFTNENGVSEGAMYDRVSGQIFRNAGTGAFVIGPDKTANSAGGGGYKCVNISRSRFSRRSRSSRISRPRHFQRWEVAA